MGAWQLKEQSLVSAGYNAYDITYTYSATQNNGRILQTSNTATGENVSYTYDSLSRLATANGRQECDGGLGAGAARDGQRGDEPLHGHVHV